MLKDKWTILIRCAKDIIYQRTELPEGDKMYFIIHLTMGEEVLKACRD